LPFDPIPSDVQTRATWTGCSASPRRAGPLRNRGQPDFNIILAGQPLSPAPLEGEVEAT
jgi:hypothetical protein